MSMTTANRYRAGTSERLDALVALHPDESLWIVHGWYGMRGVWLPKGRKTSNRMMAVTQYFQQYGK